MKIYAIGTKFMRNAGKKNAAEATVVDILKTYNNAGELVDLRYVVEHSYGHGVLQDKTIDAVTIARNLISEPDTI